MTEQERVISQLCIEMQRYCNDLCVDHNFLFDSYNLGCIEHCIEKIHRIVNPDFNKICEAVEAAEREEPKEVGVERQTCSWCGQGGNMQFVSKCKPTRYFCNEHCLKNWTCFNTKPE